MSKNFQITNVTKEGVVVLHPETNAEAVKDTGVKKVPTIKSLNSYDATAREVTEGRGVKLNLNKRFLDIEKEITAERMLELIKSVDGKDSGLDAASIGGVQVNDAGTGTNFLWTAGKTQKLLEGKLDSSEVVDRVTAGKVLRLNRAGKLPANIEGSSTSLEGTVIDDLSDRDSLWTSTKINAELKKRDEKIKAIVKIEEENDQVKIDNFIIRHGSVNITGLEAVIIDMSAAFPTTVFYDSYSIEYEAFDTEFIVTKREDPTLLPNQVKYVFSKPAPLSKLKWIAFGY